MSDNYRDSPEWGAVVAAVNDLMRANSKNSDGVERMPLDFVLGIVSIPANVDRGEICSYHTYASSQMPHINEGLMSTMIKYFDDEFPGESE